MWHVQTGTEAAGHTSGGRALVVLRLRLRLVMAMIMRGRHVLVFGRARRGADQCRRNA
jgi:hypothetical protein